jgi:hypothetical protein
MHLSWWWPIARIQTELLGGTFVERHDEDVCWWLETTAHGEQRAESDVLLELQTQTRRSRGNAESAYHETKRNRLVIPQHGTAGVTGSWSSGGCP